MQSYIHLTNEERTCLAFGISQGQTIRKIAQVLNRSAATICREIKRNSINGRYNPALATELYKERRKHSKKEPILKKDSDTKQLIHRFLTVEKWSPKIISMVLRLKYAILIGTSTIYRAIKANYFEGCTERNTLRRRGKRRHLYGGGKTITPQHTIHDRPDIIEQRGRIGDWEGDTVSGGIGKGCLLTLVDRKSRFCIARVLHARDKVTLKKAIIDAFKGVVVHSITLDNGSELLHKEIAKELNATIYFTDTHSPWQRGSNENLNGHLRWYYEKGYDFRQLSQDDLDVVIDRVNRRYRECLNWQTPKEVFQ